MEWPEYLKRTMDHLGTAIANGFGNGEPNEATLLRRCFVDGVTPQDAAEVLCGALTIKVAHKAQPDIGPAAIGDLVDFDAEGVHGRGILLNLDRVSFENSEGPVPVAFVGVPGRAGMHILTPEHLRVVRRGWWAVAART